MSTYKKILVSVDLTDEATEVLAAANEIRQEQDADLHILTVIRPISYAYGGYDTPAIVKVMANFESEANQMALTKLNALCKPHKIPTDNVHVVFGRPADKIKSEAEELGVDLVVLGTHGKHGLGLLLGSTANGVLHGAPCDVLTVRVQTQD
ncbi:MAG: universal stress protein A [Limisphaerales bacterium]|jgi:universal stress protein A